MILANIGTRWVCCAIAVVAGGCVALAGRVVRYEPTAMPVVRQMLQLAAVGPQDIVYDLGCTTCVRRRALAESVHRFDA